MKLVLAALLVTWVGCGGGKASYDQCKAAAAHFVQLAHGGKQDTDLETAEIATCLGQDGVENHHGWSRDQAVCIAAAKSVPETDECMKER
jgi:hypothetical protein